jgi:hypothetical protein
VLILVYVAVASVFFTQLKQKTGFLGAKYYNKPLILVYVGLVASVFFTQFILLMILFFDPADLTHGLGLADQQVSLAHKLELNLHPG